MDFLKAAIASSKASLTSKKGGLATAAAAGEGTAKRSAAATEDEPPTKRFKSRGEIEQEKREQEQREKEQRIKARAAEAAAAAAAYVPRDRRKEEEAEAAAQLAARDAEAGMISANEVKRRLRSYSEPITLFGETDLARFNRLKLFELHQHERLTSSHGHKNVFAQILQQDVESEIKAAMMKDMEEQRKSADGDDGAKDAAAAAGAGSAAAAASSDDATADAAAGVELDETGKVIKSSSKSSKVDYRGKDMSRSDFDTAEEFILYFFKRMLGEWEAELDARPKEVRLSERGKMASATQKQTRAFIKPLFKLLKTRTTSEDILKACEKMATACLRGQYSLAQESYLTMAIGNAAWPMGVTMVSIHERAGRTKIFSGQVAHVLNDETQRKYIQSVKRLMTFCEEHYPRPILPPPVELEHN